MDKIKNYAIAILTGLLVLSLFTQPAQSAPAKSKEAKAMEYHICMSLVTQSPTYGIPFPVSVTIDASQDCAKLRP